MPNHSHTDGSLGIWPQTAILAGFWLYVTLSNVLYAHSMNAGFASMSNERHFAPWDERVLQHIFLFPAICASVWAAMKIGWQPAWYAVPMQLVIAAVFSVLGAPALMGSGVLLGHSNMSDSSMGQTSHWFSAQDAPLWLASAINMLLAYGFGLALVMGFHTYRRFRDTGLQVTALEREYSAARLASLRMQLSPHTLFNLLNTIHGQIAWDPKSAQTMVVQLSDFLRRLLRAADHDFWGLQDEIRFARLYLELQQQRFTDRLSIIVPDAAEVAGAWVPSLILQPLVENAVVHGLAGHEGLVAIHIEFIEQARTITLRVRNTVAANRAVGPGGIGIRNVRERLAVHFGDRATFNSGAGAPNSWCAEIQLPLLKEGG